jgi:hypothetical protein
MPNSPYATKDDLKDFAEQITTRIVTELRDEFNSKLLATEERLKLHTEEVVATHSSEILQTIADVVEPLQRQVTRHEHLLAKLKPGIT